ncbi:VOC family protein [Flagellimonas onchidii]|uniref:VOC family protein n=1 Tax=Flagellimonas onchidii TaxID=2562684 RepID=UPI001F0DE682|nr:hypothetical protein [Allomuricauda onchidii]
MDRYSKEKYSVRWLPSRSLSDVQNELGRVEDAGGKILRPKTQISPEVGYMGVFSDSEGNRIALHSRE